MALDLYTIQGTIEQGQLAVDSLCYNYKYQDRLEDETGDSIDNPETRVAFAKRKLIDFLKDNIKSYRVEKFEEDRDNILESAEAEVEGLTTN